VLGAKSTELHGEPQPGAPVILVRCDVLCGAVTVRHPDWLMRRRARRASAASGPGKAALTTGSGAELVLIDPQQE
jgi:hypothetical protein